MALTSLNKMRFLHKTVIKISSSINKINLDSDICLCHIKIIFDYLLSDLQVQ